MVFLLILVLLLIIKLGYPENKSIIIHQDHLSRGGDSRDLEQRVQEELRPIYLVVFSKSNAIKRKFSGDKSIAIMFVTGGIVF